MIDKDCVMSISRQCGLLDLNRSTYCSGKRGSRAKIWN